VIHQLTDLAAGFGHEQLRANARLRRVGTRHLVDAMLATSGRRLVAQSAAWLYASGPTPHTEDDPLRDPEASPDDQVTPGILELERLVLRTAGIDGLVLRYGFLYGPGTANRTPRDISEGPYVHVTDAARAAALAVERGTAGAYNIVERADTVSNMRARKELGWEPMNRAPSATSRPDRAHGS
jgi:nucleoside-diphosphate-sugar epimerase